MIQLSNSWNESNKVQKNTNNVEFYNNNNELVQLADRIFNNLIKNYYIISVLFFHFRTN